MSEGNGFTCPECKNEAIFLVDVISLQGETIIEEDGSWDFLSNGQFAADLLPESRITCKACGYCDWYREFVND